MSVSYNYFNTTQRGPSAQLITIVERHRRNQFCKPIAAHQRDIFVQVKKFIAQHDKAIIIDSGCGTGMSTHILAEQYPDHVVVGFDKSAARLSRAARVCPSNALLLRADLIDMWRLLSAEPWPIIKHCIFFPNPWPKASQIKRRFHAHPVFALMANLATELELRTNWEIYAQEFELALKIIGHRPTCFPKSDQSYMTLFEKKYVEHQCPIFIVKSLRLVQDTYC